MISETRLSFNQRIVIEARTWIDTPWQHNQKCKGHGVDCVQFVVATCQAVGIPVGNLENYYRTPKGNSLFNYINSLPNTRLIESDEQGSYRKTELKQGQLLLFKIKKIPHHVGIATGKDSFIHANDRTGKVQEHSFGFYRRLLAGVFDIIE